MKRIVLLIAIVASTFFAACEGPEGPRGATGYSAESTVIDLKNVNFTQNLDGDYTIYREFDFPVILTDNVVMYRLSGTINSNTPIWQPIPRTIYFENSPNEFDYDYDFSQVDFTIYAGGNYNITTTPDLLNNETFRVVVIPGSFANKSSKIEAMDYDTLIAKYHIDDSNVKVIN